MNAEGEVMLTVYDKNHPRVRILEKLLRNIELLMWSSSVEDVTSFDLLGRAPGSAGTSKSLPSKSFSVLIRAQVL